MDCGAPLPGRVNLLGKDGAQWNWPLSNMVIVAEKPLS
jgi:hypothetical protein